jgi:hypothetical protein
MLRRSITTFVLVTATAAPCGAMTTIDFETPSLGASGSAIINPYVADGVTFTAVSAGFGDEIVGLVKNSATSACADPADANQKLGSGRSSFPNGSIGFGIFAIRADFPPPPVVTDVVSVEFQLLSGQGIRLRLFNAGGTEVGSATDVSGPPDGTCGNPGGPRARTTLVAVASEPAAYAIMDVLTPGPVLVIDNFSFGNVPTPVSNRSWGTLKLLYR